MLFWLSVFALSALLVMRESPRPSLSSRNISELNRATVTFRYRATLIAHVPNPVKSLFGQRAHAAHGYAALATFEEQASAGLTSESFDIEANIRDGDSRSGLDERSTQEVLEIMRRERVKCVLLSVAFHVRVD